MMLVPGCTAGWQCLTDHAGAALLLCSSIQGSACSHAATMHGSHAQQQYAFMTRRRHIISCQKPCPLLAACVQVKELNLEEGGAFTVSNADALLKAL